MSDIRGKIIGFILLVVVGITSAVIFLFSAESGTDSSATSKKATEAVAESIIFDYDDYGKSEQADLVKALEGFIRKMGHFCVFGLLGTEAFFCGYFLFKKRRYALIFPALYCLAAAVADEVHQLYVPNREGKLTDVLIDGAGWILGGLLCYFVIGLVFYVKSEIKRCREG